MSELPSHIPINKQRTSCAQKNDRLGWRDGFSASVDGVSLGVRSNDPAILGRLRNLLPGWVEPGEAREVDLLLSLLVGKPSSRPGVKNYHLLYCAWERKARTLDLEEAVQNFADLIIPEVALRSHQEVYLQARLASLQEGRDPILVFGAQEQTDRFVEILQGSSHPGERRSEGGPTGNLVSLDSQVKIRKISPQGELSWVRSSSLVFLDQEAKTEVGGKPLPAGLAVLHLLRYAPAATRHPQSCLDRFSQLALRTPAFQGSYQDAERSAHSLLARSAAPAD